MRRLKKILSILIIMTIILPLLPINELKAIGQSAFTVDSITVFRTFQDFTSPGEFGVNIRGEGLSKVTIGYFLDIGEFVPLTNPGPGSDDYFRQYKIPAGTVISKIAVGNKEFIINETNMPKIESVDPRQIDLNDEDPKLKIKGRNFSHFGTHDEYNTTIRVENVNITKEMTTVENEVTFNKDAIRQFGYGNKNIIIERKSKVDNVDINIVYNQINPIRIMESIILDLDDVTIYPNRGRIGSQTTITINNKKENFSIFFLKEETDLFKYENLGENPEYQQTTDNKSIIKVRIPKGLKVGETYKVVITNNIDDIKKPGLDMTNFITKQKVIGEFYVVDSTVGPRIDKLVPNQGTSDGSYLTIYGYRFEELKISELMNIDNQVSKLSVSESGSENPTKLKIDYNIKENTTYKGKKVTKLTRDFLVTIGRDTLFEETHLSKNIFRLGDNQLDELYLKTKTIDPKDLQDPTKDVVMAITTTITINEDGKEETFVFTELEVLVMGYTFLPSYNEPTIKSITPDKIQIDSESNPVTKHTTIHSIEGMNFNVFRYEENGEMKTNYPKILLGGSTESNAQIIIEKNSDGKVTYYTRKNNVLEETTVEDAFFEVINQNGNIVTGVGGNETGNFITFTLPKDLQVSIESLNKPLDIGVANPKRDSWEKSMYNYKKDVLQFVTSRTLPTIESVTPYIVTVEGGESIKVEGRGFENGIEVYIDGKKIPDVKRDIDTLSTRGVLTFKAPKGREGINIIHVMNPDGGSDTHEFIFVQTLRIDPRITTITPPRGTEGDVIIIKGDNFLKKDISVTDIKGMGLYKLLGTRVFLGTEEVNQYVENGPLANYSAPDINDEPLLIKEYDSWANMDVLKLSPHYKEALIKDEDKNFYIISKDRDGEIILIGKDKTYYFNLSEDNIIASDSSTIYTVVLEGNQIKLITEEETKLTLTVDYDYSVFSIRENQLGKKELKLASYYDSLILDDGNKYYKIERDSLNRITITDEKNSTYEIKLDGDKIVATKGSDKYDVNVQLNSISFNNTTYEFKTPYYIDPLTKIITGHRVRVLTKNEIEIIVPEKQIAGFYDVKVENPDTKFFTVTKGFEYTKPQIKPIINYIEPSEGSVDGGYYITILGEHFGDNPEVRINGVLVPAKDTIVNKEDYKSIKVLVPKYTGNVDQDFITDKKYVRVHVTSGGASSSRNDLFAYKMASSKPKITKIQPIKGSTAGGNIVIIEGTDFRFFEPYKGNPPKPGDTNYEDIDGDGKWTNYHSHKDGPLDSPVLPSIYFGSNKAKIVEFERPVGSDIYRIMVLAPESNIAGTVDVYLRNNDSGQTPPVKYTYEASKPNIKTINPNTGNRAGGEIKDIVATGYQGTKLIKVDKDGKEIETTMYLIRFGDISNKALTNLEDPNYGLIRGGIATVDLVDSGLKAELRDSQLTLTLKEGDKEYIGKYPLLKGSKYIDLKSLKEKKDNTPYPGYELVKFDRAGGRLIVERGYAPTVEERVVGTLEVTTPSYYRGTKVDVTLVNLDGISNKMPFTYVNPGSKPTITNILKDGANPSQGDGGRTRVVQVNSKGGNVIQVIGTDFRPNATITIGNDFLTIKPEFISETQLKFTMPAVTDANMYNNWYTLIVKNQDHGEARSDQSKPTPIYIEIKESESNPTASNIEPNWGPVSGGTKVTITGEDFRDKMEGFENGKLTVVFGDKEITDVKFNRYDSITVTAPSAPKPGPVQIKVKNPDGTLTAGNIIFNYISKPKIKDMDPKKLFTNDTNTVVTIKGEMFQQGARVLIGAKLEDAKSTDTDKYLYGVDNNGKNIEKIIVGGIEAATVEVISDTEIKVTFKDATELDSTNIIIVNPDRGISDPYNDFKYEIPLPDKPMVLEGIAGYESTVMLIWNESDKELLNKATNYEIYGRKTSDRTNTFIATTDRAEYLVKGLEKDTRYTFMVRALNEYGAALDFATVTVKTLSSREDYKQSEKEDTLRDDEKTLDNKGKEVIQGTIVTRTLGKDDINNSLGFLDFSSSKYNNINEFKINIPLALARTDSTLYITDKVFALNINPKNLYTKEVSLKDKGDKDSNLQIIIKRGRETNIPRGSKVASNVYEISFAFQVGKEVITIDKLQNSATLSLYLDSSLYTNTKNVGMGVFNYQKGSYDKINSSTTVLNQKGKYLLLSDR